MIPKFVFGESELEEGLLFVVAVVYGIFTERILLWAYRALAIASRAFGVSNPLVRPELPSCRGFQASARYLVCVYVSLLTMYSHGSLDVAI